VICELCWEFCLTQNLQAWNLNNWWGIIKTPLFVGAENGVIDASDEIEKLLGSSVIFS